MTHDAFLQAIVEAPDDDVPRLIYADWLDDNGDPDRAEFIRTQIVRARLPADDDRQAELAAREKELERFDWARALSPCAARPFIRGFPDHVGFPGRRSSAERVSAADLAALTDAVERVPVRTFSAPLLGCSHSNYLSAGATFPAEGESGLETLAAWPGLRRLTGLEVLRATSHAVTQGDFTSGLRALAGSPYAVGLERLILGRCSFEPGTLLAVGTSPYLPHLVELKLSCLFAVVVGPALDGLLTTPLGVRLRRLDCAWVGVAPGTVRAYLDVSPLCELRFGAAWQEMDDRTRALSLGPLLGAPGLARLRLLGLTGEAHGFDTDEMPDASSDMVMLPDLRELLASPLLANLEELELSGIHLGDDGARTLADAPLARNLIALKLDLCGLTGAGLAALRPLLAEGRLRRLSLSHNPFEKEDAADLASWPELGRLHELNLNYFNHLGDAGEAVLSASPHRHPWLKLS